MSMQTGEVSLPNARLLQELRILKDENVTLHVDNEDALQFASNSMYHNRTKHIDIKYHRVREMVQTGIVELG